MTSSSMMQDSQDLAGMSQEQSKDGLEAKNSLFLNGGNTQSSLTNTNTNSTNNKSQQSVAFTQESDCRDGDGEGRIVPGGSDRAAMTTESDPDSEDVRIAARGNLG